MQLIIVKTGAFKNSFKREEKKLNPHFRFFDAYIHIHVNYTLTKTKVEHFI